jgi:hypothetical protein
MVKFKQVRTIISGPSSRNSYQKVFALRYHPGEEFLPKKILLFPKVSRPILLPGNREKIVNKGVFIPTLKKQPYRARKKFSPLG